MSDRHDPGLPADGLSARQKGDIYWKKLKYFLQAVQDKNVSLDNERKGRYIAKQLLERKKSESVGEISEYIGGNEFKMRPPTSTGEMAYEDSIWKAICNLNYFRDVLKKGAETSGESDSIVLKRLNSLQKVIGETVDVCFRSNGVNFNTGTAVSEEEIQKAKSVLTEKTKQYENAVKQFKNKVALSIVDSLKDKFSRESVRTDSGMIKGLIEEKADNYRENKGIIDKALKEFETISKKRSGAEAELVSLNKYAEEKGMDTRPVSFMDFSEVIGVYKDCMEDYFFAAKWAETACATCIRFLLTGAEPDPFMSNYIHSHWKVDTDTFSGDTTAYSLPGYVRLEYDKEDPALYHYETVTDVRRGIEELGRYRKAHPHQFRYQMIADLLFGIEELPEIVGKSRALRNTMFGWAQEGLSEDLSAADKEDMREMWVQAETTERVAEQVLEYHRDSERRTMKELIASYLYDTQDMDYRLQEKSVRSCLEKWMSERDGQTEA